MLPLKTSERPAVCLRRNCLARAGHLKSHSTSNTLHPAAAALRAKADAKADLPSPGSDEVTMTILDRESPSTRICPRSLSRDAVRAIPARPLVGERSVPLLTCGSRP